MGFITADLCISCGKDTFAQDRLCAQCRIELEQTETTEQFSFGQVDCE